MAAPSPVQHESLPYRTAADLERLRADLGDVPAERIWLIPIPGTATEADCVSVVESANKRLVELVQGTLVEKAVGYQESWLAMWLGSLIMQFVQKHRLGIVLPPDGLHRMSRGNIREPDVAFTAWADVPDGRPPAAKVCPPPGPWRLKC